MKRMTTLFFACMTLLGSVFINNISAQIIDSRNQDALRVMCYNVRNCKGMDGVTDYQRVADVINRASPDVVAVQELDSVTKRSQERFVLKEIADRTQMHWTYAPAIDFQGGKYGIGVLSKEEPIGFKRLPLPGREESRMLLIVEFKEYILACTHFSLTEEDQLLSVPVILNAIKDVKKPLFLAGDMNSEYDTLVQERLRENFITLNDHNDKTFPVVNPDRCIDYIYGYKNGTIYTVLERQVLVDEQKASDHLPLFVDVSISIEN